MWINVYLKLLIEIGHIENLNDRLKYLSRNFLINSRVLFDYWRWMWSLLFEVVYLADIAFKWCYNFKRKLSSGENLELLVKTLIKYKGIKKHSCGLPEFTCYFRWFLEAVLNPYCLNFIPTVRRRSCPHFSLRCV